MCLDFGYSSDSWDFGCWNNSWGLDYCSGSWDFGHNSESSNFGYNSVGRDFDFWSDSWDFDSAHETCLDLAKSESSYLAAMYRCWGTCWQQWCTVVPLLPLKIYIFDLINKNLRYGFHLKNVYGLKILNRGGWYYGEKSSARIKNICYKCLIDFFSHLN